MFNAIRSMSATLGLAVRNLLLHKLRSVLTVMGLVFGVASVIAMLAIAEGASLEAQRQIEQRGATNVIVRSIKPTADKESRQEESVLIYGLTYADLERIEETVPTVVGATPLREFVQEMRYLDRSIDGTVVGATPDYSSMNHVEMMQGRFLSEIDLDTFQNVCVIGHDIAEKLFPYENPVGKSIRIGRQHYYRIVGVAAYKAPSSGAGSSLSGIDYNKHAYVPLSTNRLRFGELIIFGNSGSRNFERIELSQITVAVNKIDEVKRTSETIEGLLAQFHPRGDYAITVPLELLEKAEATKRIFNLVLGSIAGISLLVGGIGIMNIMLATVTERTREIGIRRALGARRWDITVQFLLECTVLSCTGGMLGVVVGLVVPDAVTRLSGQAGCFPRGGQPCWTRSRRCGANSTATVAGELVPVSYGGGGPLQSR